MLNFRVNCHGLPERGRKRVWPSCSCRFWEHDNFWVARWDASPQVKLSIDPFSSPGAVQRSPCVPPAVCWAQTSCSGGHSVSWSRRVCPWRAGEKHFPSPPWAPWATWQGEILLRLPKPKMGVRRWVQRLDKTHKLITQLEMMPYSFFHTVLSPITLILGVYL